MLAVKTRLAAKLDDVSWAHFYGAPLLAGTGFTMSLFIGTLAFEGPSSAADVRIGVLAGSFLAGTCGFLLLRFATPVPVVSPRKVAEPKPGTYTAPSVVGSAS